MDPIKQKIAIAKACGWTPIDMGSLPTAWKHPDTPDNVDIGKKDVINSNYLPDYLNDLNAIHEAVTQYDNFGFQLSFHSYLVLVVHTPEEAAKKSESRFAEFLVTNATAAQRAEAFLRTLNLWTTET